MCSPFLLFFSSREWDFSSSLDSKGKKNPLELEKIKILQHFSLPTTRCKTEAAWRLMFDEVRRSDATGLLEAANVYHIHHIGTRFQPWIPREPQWAKLIQAQNYRLSPSSSAQNDFYLSYIPITPLMTACPVSVHISVFFFFFSLLLVFLLPSLCFYPSTMTELHLPLYKTQEMKPEWSHEGHLLPYPNSGVSKWEG